MQAVTESCKQQAVHVWGLAVHPELHEVVNEIAFDAGVDAAKFWRSLEDLITELGPRNKGLLARRDELQVQSAQGA